MIGVTLFGLIFTPVFYILIRRLFPGSVVIPAKHQLSVAPLSSRLAVSLPPGINAEARTPMLTSTKPQSFTLNVNGRAATVSVDDPDMPLLYALRNDLHLHGPRFGCGLGQCGACTVHIDGVATRSCITPISSVGDGKIV
eukprot:gene53673-73401_t